MALGEDMVDTIFLTRIISGLKVLKFDGSVKSPTSALCCISQSFNVRNVRFMITKFARLEFELFTKPSKSDFLRVHQIWGFAPIGTAMNQELLIGG